MWRAHYWTHEEARYLLERYEGVVLGATALYVPLLFLLQNFMRHRQPFQLKYLYFFWNITLSFFSGVGVFIFLFFDPACLLKTSLLEPECHPCVRACVYTFCLTKAVEFGDTFLLALKKKPLRFLHVYHHLTVTLYCWHAVKVSASFGHLFAFINLTIHCFMYLYFAFATLYPRHPLLLASSCYITICQTTQMFVGMYLSFSVVFRGLNGSMVLPTLEQENAMFALFLYTSYAYLFVLFYVERYIKNARPSMVLALTTLHLGGLIGAVFVWNHPQRYRLFIEIAIGYSLTALFAYLCFHSFPKMVRCRNFLRILVGSETPYTTDFVKKPEYYTNPNVLYTTETSHSTPELLHPVPSSLSSVHVTVDSQKGHPCDAKHVSSSSTLCCKQSIDHDKTIMSQLNVSDDPFLVVHEFSVYTTPHNYCRIKQALAFFNAWVLAVLEKYQESYQKIAVCQTNRSKPSFHAVKTRQCLHETSRLLKYVPFSWIFLKDSDALPLLGEQFFFFIASLFIPALYGFIAHGNVLLGILVHGCLRWIIELYTTGVLVST